MTKKRLIATLIAVLIIIVIGVLAGVVFVVRDVEIDFSNQEMMDAKITKDQIIQHTNIQMGKSIFSISESKIVSNIESAFPTIKVRGVERVFPNKIIIHLVERVPMVAIKFKGYDEYLILDNNMCAMEKVECSKGEINKKLKDVCLVDGIELDGQRDIFLGKQLPRIYGDEVVIVQDIIQALINSGMELNVLKDFIGGIDFSVINKNVYIKTKYGSGYGVTIEFNYDGITDKEVIASRVIQARQAFQDLSTSERANGSLVYFEYDDKPGEYVYIGKK